MQIPELAVVVVGSQMGRCALLTMNRVMGAAKRDLVMQYTFRLDKILPTPAQDNCCRPMFPFLGLAVSPVPETHPRGVRKRFRLFLHYQDHTILSYEIHREQRGALVVL